MINLYKILGIKKSDNKTTIKKAYHKLSKIHHPDTGGDAEKFKMIDKAYKILIDDDKRKRYDKGENVDSILRSKNDNNEEIKIINDIFFQLMEKQNSENVNIIEQIDESIDLNISNVSKTILELSTSIGNYKTFLKKLKHKNKKNNLMIQISNGHIIIKNKKLEIFKNKKNNLEKAKKLIKDYDYDIVEEIKFIVNSFSSAITGGDFII